MIGNLYITRTADLYETLELTYPIIVDDICPVTLKAGPIPNWKLMTMIFSPETWISCVALFFIILISWYVLRKLNQHITESRVSFYEVLFESFELFIIVGLNRNIQQLYERLYIVPILWALVIISVAGFQGSLSSIFTTVFNYPEIDTLKSVLEHGLRIYIGNVSSAHTYYGPDSINPEVREMGRRVTTYSAGPTPLHLPKIIKDAMVIVTKSFAEAGPWAKYFQDFGGEFHLVKECSGPTYKGFPMRGHGFLNHRIQVINLKLFEGGFFNYWYINMVNGRKAESWALRNSTLDNDDGNTHLLSLDDLLIPFIILIVGYIWSSVSFILEWIFFVINKSLKS